MVVKNVTKPHAKRKVRRVLGRKLHHAYVLCINIDNKKKNKHLAFVEFVSLK